MFCKPFWAYVYISLYISSLSLYIYTYIYLGMGMSVAAQAPAELRRPQGRARERVRRPDPGSEANKGTLTLRIVPQQERTHLHIKHSILRLQRCFLNKELLLGSGSPCLLRTGQSGAQRRRLLPHPDRRSYAYIYIYICICISCVVRCIYVVCVYIYIYIHACIHYTILDYDII